MSDDEYQALIRRVDINNVFMLNRLNAAMAHGLAMMRAERLLTFEERTTIDILRDAAFVDRWRLRQEVAEACAPWFEVQQ